MAALTSGSSLALPSPAPTNIGATQEAAMLAARADSLRHVLWLRSRPTRRWRFPHRFPANIGVTSVAAILAARADSLRHVLWLRSRPAAKNV